MLDKLKMSNAALLLPEIVELVHDLFFLTEANLIQSRDWLEFVTTPDYEMPSHVNIGRGVQNDGSREKGYCLHACRL